jgi:hypothetical protein
MAISYSTAKWVAPLSFIIDFAAQQYGMFAIPNMKDIHDRNLSFFSPQPFFIAAFFFPQQIVQLVWLYRLYKLDPKKGQVGGEELDQQVDYVPYYALGNLCIAGREVPRLDMNSTVTGTSVDGLLELRASADQSPIRYDQYSRTAPLHDCQAASNERAVNLLSPYTCRLEDICWHWRPRLFAQRIRCVLQGSTCDFANPYIGRYWVWTGQHSE